MRISSTIGEPQARASRSTLRLPTVYQTEPGIGRPRCWRTLLVPGFGLRLTELFEHAIQFRFRFDDLAGVDQRPELLFHRLEDGGRVAPAGHPFLRALLGRARPCR